MYMKRLTILFASLLFAVTIHAQRTDLTAFVGRIYNSEYKVYIVMDFQKQNVLVPDQEIFGPLPGYFGSSDDSRKWLFTNVKGTGAILAHIKITNDYGSEDLTATLQLNKDGSYTFKQVAGSTLKIARNRKWVKIPAELVFTRCK